MRSWKLGAAWVVALVVTTLLTWQIVSLADTQVNAGPVELIPTTSTTVPVSATTSPTASDVTAATTTVPGVEDGSAPSTSSSPVSTAASGDSWTMRSISTAGGTVVVRYRSGAVELQAATPAPGFDVEVDDSEGERLRVEFEGHESDFRVEARWVDGDLQVVVTDGS